MRQIVHVSQQLTIENCREPILEEIARKMNLLVEKVRRTLQAMRGTYSLEQPVGEKRNGACLKDFCYDTEKLTLEESVSVSLFKQQLAEVLRTLPSREEKILRLRHGLEDNRIYVGGNWKRIWIDQRANSSNGRKRAAEITLLVPLEKTQRFLGRRLLETIKPGENDLISIYKERFFNERFSDLKKSRT